MGDTRAETKRRRAVGTRDRIMSRLAQAGPIYDESGMASAMLAREVGYPGSSVAFAQLLSGMERSGLIEREVRGKRTYRINAAPGATMNPAKAGQKATAAGHAAGTDTTDAGGAGGADAGGGNGTSGPRAHAGSGDPAAARRGSAGTAPGSERMEGAPVGARHQTAQADTDAELALAATEPGDFDYDELARRLLVEVVRRLAATPTEAALPPARPPSDATLEQTVAGLERELASARTAHGTLTEENARLRRQLQAARRSLALVRRSAGQPVTDQLDAAEVSLLERLLAHSAEETRSEGTG
jgi:hypothetical protein